MSLNACSLNAQTINGLRCRSASLFRPAPPPVLGTNNSSVSIDFAKRFPHLIRHAEEEERPPLTFEQPFVTVTVELQGEVRTQRLEMDNRLDFVTVTDLQVAPAVSITVTDLQVLDLDVAVSITDFKVE